MISSTPATALIKTNKKTETRCIQSWTSRGRFSDGSSRIVGASVGRWGSGALPGAPENMGSLIQLALRWKEWALRLIPGKKDVKAIRPILRLQGLNALGDVAVIDVASVDVHEVFEGRSLIASRFISRRQFVMESDPRLAVDGRHFQSLVVPADSGLGNAVVEEALRQPGVRLHDLRARMPVIERLNGFLKLSDGLVEQAHFTESDTEVVVRLGILVGGCYIGLEIFFQLAEHVCQIDASVFPKRGRFGGRGRRRRRQYRRARSDRRHGSRGSYRDSRNCRSLYRARGNRRHWRCRRGRCRGARSQRADRRGLNRGHRGRTRHRLCHGDRSGQLRLRNRSRIQEIFAE